jgi:hypothetical protein
LTLRDFFNQRSPSSMRVLQQMRPPNRLIPGADRGIAGTEAKGLLPAPRHKHLSRVAARRVGLIGIAIIATSG